MKILIRITVAVLFFVSLVCFFRTGRVFCAGGEIPAFEEEIPEFGEEIPEFEDEEEVIPAVTKKEKKPEKKKEVKEEEIKREEKQAPAPVPAGKEAKKEIRKENLVFKIYEAKGDETLSSISEKFYNDPNRWEEIWKYNEYVKDPTRIFARDTLLIPFDRTEIEKAEAQARQVKGEKKEHEKQVFIAPGDFEFEGVITGLKDKDLLMPVAGDVVFIDSGSEQEVKAGDLFTIYRKGHSVNYPRTGEYLGDCMSKIGVLRVTADVGENDSTAVIIKSYDPVLAGDFLLRRK